MTTVATTMSHSMMTYMTQSHQRSLPKLPNAITGVGRLGSVFSLLHRLADRMKLVDESGSEAAMVSGRHQGRSVSEECVLRMAGVSHEMSFKTQEETVLLLLKNWRAIAVSLAEP